MAEVEITWTKMKLKRKYRVGGQMNKGRTDAGGNSGKSHRHKLDAQQKARLPKQKRRALMVHAGGGKSRFVNYDDVNIGA